MNHTRPTPIPAVALRRALVDVPLACAALLGVPQAHAATVDVPCGQAVFETGPGDTVVLHRCSYPSLFVSGPSVVEGNGAVIDMASSGAAIAFAGYGTLRDLHITGGSEGGLRLNASSVTLERVVISGNRSSNLFGGGIESIGFLHSLTLIDTTIRDNTAPRGGGMWLRMASGGKVKIVRSTFSGNRAVNTTNDGTTGSGGAFEISDNVSGWSLEISNSTFSGNHADFYGGAMLLQGNGSATISDTTITDNSAGLDGDAILDNTGGVPDPGLHVRRTIIAGNGLDSVFDCGGSYSDFKQDYGYNVLVPECVGALAEATTQVLSASNGALLGALADNGGPTQTHLPLDGSPALDVIPLGEDGCGTNPTTDQRGVTRPQLDGCDIGAVEATDTTAPVAAPTLSSGPNAAGWHNAPVTVTWNWSDDGAGIDTTNCTASSTSSGDGEVTLSASCADLAGNLGTSSLVVDIDTTAPETLLTVMPPLSTTSTSASFSFSGSDATSGLGGFECQLDSGAFSPCTSPQSFSGLALGSHTFMARGIDVAGHVDATPASFTWSIVAIPTISWSGVLQPINADGSSVFKAGSVVSVKFALTGASAGRTDLTARLSYAKTSDNVAGPVNEANAPGNGTSGNLFKYDPATGQYYFNWSTKGLSAGTYELIIDLGDGNPRRVGLGLR